MSIIKLHDKYFKKYISQDKINKAVQVLVDQVYKDCKNEIPLFIGILNGSFMFMADFVRQYKGNCEVSFVKLASYQGTNSSGKIKQLVGINENLEDRTIVILEDIIDTGNTLEELYKIFNTKKLKQLKIATLFFKPDVFKKDLPINYIGIPIPDKFIVGYGLDYDGLGRNLPSIYQLTKKPTMKNIVLFGPPGAGKGTQAKLLESKYGLIHISTGDVFRYNIRNNTQLGKLAKSYIDGGNFVPDEVTIHMLEEKVNETPNAKGFIFDGYPRTTSQAIALDKFLLEKGETVSGMIALEVPEEELVQRILKRGKTSERPDDANEEKIRYRFNEYHAKTEILKEFYLMQHKYFGVNGVGSIEEISKCIFEIIDKL